MQKPPEKKATTESGFTLLELAIVIVIFALVMITFFGMYDVGIRQYRIAVTEKRMEDIQQALFDFITKEQRLPCVASFKTRSSEEEFGRETDCSAAAEEGTFSATGRNGMDVRIGMVPVRTLQAMYADDEQSTLSISKNHAYDAWGNKFTLAVTSIMATNGLGFANNKGAIQVLDSEGNTLTSPDSEVMLTLTSHGPDNKGSYLYDSDIVTVACDGGDLSDKENCDNDATFVHTLMTSDAETKKHFDDRLVFNVKNQIQTPAITSFTVEKMACIEAEAGPEPANVLGERCATMFITQENIRIDPATQEPRDGRLIYSSDFVAAQNGRAIIRATIPLRVSVWPDDDWTDTVLAAIYLNDTLIQSGEIKNPTNSSVSSQGGTGIVIASAFIEKNTEYTVRIYVYGIGSGGGNSMGFVGAIKLNDHSVDGVVEIIQSGMFQ